jgi:hypothetical protein
MTALIIGALLAAGFFLSSGSVVGQTASGSAADAQSYAIIQSRFMLWDSFEKSMDNTFNVVLFSWSNQSYNYSVNIDMQWDNGSFYQFKVLNYTYKNITRLGVIDITINNITVLHATNIRLITGMTQHTIDEYTEPYRISFLPFELTKFEWNLVFSGIVAVLICLPLAYYTVKYYRKHRGAQVL